MAGDQIVVEACKGAFEKWKGDCSGFVRAVATEVGVALTGNADTLVESMGKTWTATDRKGCLDKVRAGKLVIAGLGSKSHTPARSNGHVVVIVDGDLYRGIYPKCWGGSIGSAQSNGTKSVGEVWNKTDRDAVKYFYK